MPVSRKRKTKAKSTGSRQKTAREARAARTLLKAFDESERIRERRVELARPRADALIASLKSQAGPAEGGTLEDELCAKLGPLFIELTELPIEQYVGPEDFAVALVESAAATPILPAVLAITPEELVERALDPSDARPAAPSPTGPVRWTRDRYGSRFGILAPFGSRWYLWDIDACTYRPITVRSGFHDSPEEALAAWQADVGAVASEWAEVDDGGLLDDLLPRVEGLMAVGGETVDQHAEYLRSRRLAEVLPSISASPEHLRMPSPSEFGNWQRGRGAASDDVDELADALAEVWPDQVEILYHCCSPHRVAHVSLAARDEFGDEYAERVVAVLPDWVTWLAELAGTPADLVERALPYAAGQIHPVLGDVPRLADYQAVVAE